MTELLSRSMAALAVLGSLMALVMLIPKEHKAEADKNLNRAAVLVGWAGLLAGAICIYIGVFNTLDALVGTAACAGLAVLPMTIDFRKTSSIPIALGALVPLAAGSFGLVLAIDIAGEPADAMLLYAGQWAAFSAAMTAALLASAFGWSRKWTAQQGDAPSDQSPDDNAPHDLSDHSKRLALHARDFALRAVLLGWLSWLVLILIHWRQIGAISMASPADWTLVGAMMLATATLLFFWSKRRAYYEIIFATYVAALALGVYFGAPFGLAI